jgi:hypothetical protein
MLSLGRRAGLRRCTHIDFATTFAADFLVKGGSPYDVAKLLAGTIDTVERHYLP